MCKILSQDRDLAVIYDPETMMLSMQSVIMDDKIMAVNVFCDNYLLGTFDTPREAWDEIQGILNCGSGVYEIDGFSDYDGTEDFNSLLEDFD